MPTNFELKQLKPKLDISKKPENRVHELTDSNVSLMVRAGVQVRAVVRVVRPLDRTNYSVQRAIPTQSCSANIMANIA